MKIFFSVGEPSGDLHGANLIRTLRERRPEIECIGYGGPRMAAAGCKLEFDLTELAIMWFFRVLLNIHKFFGLLWRADRIFRTERPDAVVLIDYPGFNFWIARRAKAHGIPVIYYGGPQVWAWACWRVNRIRRLIDHLLCKLPFEVPWYEDRNCQATYVGHPYFDELASRKLDEEFLAAQRAVPGRLVTILPGSRTQEVTANLPYFLRAAAVVARECPEARFAIASFNAKQAEIARELAAGAGVPLEIHVGRTPELIEAAECAMACSGSVSLELLYHVKPTVIYYQVSHAAYFVQGFFNKSRYITLANLLMHDELPPQGEEPFDPDAEGAEQVAMPEYLTAVDRSADMANWILRWLRDPAARRAQLEMLAEVRARTVHSGASIRAAEYILGVLEPGESLQPQPLKQAG